MSTEANYSPTDPAMALGDVAARLKEKHPNAKELVMAIRSFILDHAKSLPKDKQRQPKTIIESRFTPATEAFDTGMTSCGAMATVTAEMLRHVGYRVQFVHGETDDSVDHAWISVFDPINDTWTDYDPTRPQADIPLTHIRKLATDSWDDIKDQIRSDHETMRERRKARGIPNRNSERPEADNSWAAYSERTKEKSPRELLVRAMPYVLAKNHALDLGPGALNESAYLLEQGFRSVVAVNKHPLEADPVAQSRAATFPSDRFEYRVSSFDEFNFVPNTYDLINAQYSLPFNPQVTFGRMFASMIASLKPGGIITGQLFGPKDEWNDNSGRLTFLTREQVEKLLSDCEIISFEEVEGPDRLAIGGEKYWHTFHFIAQKSAR